MTTRKYTSRSQQTTLTSAVTSGALILPVASATTLLGGATVSTGQTFTVVIDPDTSLEEIVDVTVVSGNNLTVTRAVDMSGAAAQDHSAGAVVRHMIIGRDLREANTHIEASTAYNDGTGTHSLHGLGSSDGSVVGTDATQTLTNKTLVSPSITGGYLGDSSLVFEGSTADAYETTLTITDPTADRTITFPNASGNVVLDSLAQTITNKTITTGTLGSNLDAGGYKITNLATPTLASDAVRKDFADAQVAAAATSAASAATSAASAATSASSAAASATTAANSVATIASYATTASNSAAAAATSATSAATSASSALTSQTAAATSATSAAASATAAATSATSAAASATTASNSAATATTQASNAATSASSALTSQTAAATSATSAAASATAAATSATSAAASATAAATSATSAATSATSAATTYDAYDQRYLGSKASAPTVDNKGNALITGATYWNTTTTTMYVWSGSAWQAISNASAVTAVTGTSGRISSSGGSTPAIDLVATAVTAGSYTNASLTVDAYGRLTAASTGTAPVTSVSGTASQISVSGTTTPTISLATTGAGALTYAYPTTISVDAYGRVTSSATGSAPVTSVTSASTSNITVGGTSTAPTVNLATTAVSAGTYSPATITVDSYGRITAASTAAVATDPIPQILMLGGM